MSNRLPMYEGNFIKAEDLPLGKAFSFTIKSVSLPGTVEAEGKRKVDKAVIFFDGKEKSLIMNQTHYDVIKHLYGPEFDKWAGKVVVLQRRHLLKCQSGGETLYNVVCVRIIPPNGTSIRKGLMDRLGSGEPYSDAEVEKAKSKGKGRNESE